MEDAAEVRALHTEYTGEAGYAVAGFTHRGAHGGRGTVSAGEQGTLSRRPHPSPHAHRPTQVSNKRRERRGKGAARGAVQAGSSPDLLRQRSQRGLGRGLQAAAAMYWMVATTLQRLRPHNALTPLCSKPTPRPCPALPHYAQRCTPDHAMCCTR